MNEVQVLEYTLLSALESDVGDAAITELAGKLVKRCLVEARNSMKCGKFEQSYALLMKAERMTSTDQQSNNFFRGNPDLKSALRDKCFKLLTEFELKRIHPVKTSRKLVVLPRQPSRQPSPIRSTVDSDSFDEETLPPMKVVRPTLVYRGESVSQRQMYPSQRFDEGKEVPQPVLTSLERFQKAKQAAERQRRRLAEQREARTIERELVRQEYLDKQRDAKERLERELVYQRSLARIEERNRAEEERKMQEVRKARFEQLRLRIMKRHEAQELDSTGSHSTPQPPRHQRPPQRRPQKDSPTFTPHSVERKVDSCVLNVPHPKPAPPITPSPQPPSPLPTIAEASVESDIKDQWDAYSEGHGLPTRRNDSHGAPREVKEVAVQTVVPLALVSPMSTVLDFPLHISDILRLQAGDGHVQPDSSVASPVPSNKGRLDAARVIQRTFRLHLAKKTLKTKQEDLDEYLKGMGDGEDKGRQSRRPSCASRPSRRGSQASLRNLRRVTILDGDMEGSQASSVVLLGQLDHVEEDEEEGAAKYPGEGEGTPDDLSLRPSTPELVQTTGADSDDEWGGVTEGTAEEREEEGEGGEAGSIKNGDLHTESEGGDDTKGVSRTAGVEVVDEDELAEWDERAAGQFRDGEAKEEGGGSEQGSVGEGVGEAVDDAVSEMVGDTVSDAVGNEADEAVGEAGDAVSEAVGNKVGEPVDAVGNEVGEAVGEAVGDAVGEAVGEAVGDAVGNEVGEAVGEAVGNEVGEAVGEAVGEEGSDDAREEGTEEEPEDDLDQTKSSYDATLAPCAPGSQLDNILEELRLHEERLREQEMFVKRRREREKAAIAIQCLWRKAVARVRSASLKAEKSLQILSQIVDKSRLATASPPSPRSPAGSREETPCEEEEPGVDITPEMLDETWGYELWKRDFSRRISRAEKARKFEEECAVRLQCWVRQFLARKRLAKQRRVQQSLCWSNSIKRAHRSLLDVPSAMYAPRGPSKAFDTQIRETLLKIFAKQKQKAEADQRRPLIVQSFARTKLAYLHSAQHRLHRAARAIQHTWRQHLLRHPRIIQSTHTPAPPRRPNSMFVGQSGPLVTPTPSPPRTRPATAPFRHPNISRVPSGRNLSAW